MPRLLPIIALCCLAAAPAAPTLTADEEAQLAKDKVVVRHAGGDTGGGVTAIAMVDAPPRVVLDQVMNLAARPNESSALTSVDVYRSEAVPDRTGATFTITVMGSKTVFSILYSCERDQGYCTYALDPSKKSDLVRADGFYLVQAVGSRTRLVYASKADTGRSMPGWVRRWIAGSSLTSQVEGIRKRAEALR